MLPSMTQTPAAPRRRRALLLSVLTFVVTLILAALAATALVDDMGGLRAGFVAGLASGAAVSVYFRSRGSG